MKVLGFASSGNGLLAITLASSARDSTTTLLRTPKVSSRARSSSVVIAAVSLSLLVKTTLPLWM
jgi:hypothetical protein